MRDFDVSIHLLVYVKEACARKCKRGKKKGKFKNVDMLARVGVTNNLHNALTNSNSYANILVE